MDLVIPPTLTFDFHYEMEEWPTFSGEPFGLTGFGLESQGVCVYSASAKKQREEMRRVLWKC